MFVAVLAVIVIAAPTSVYYYFQDVYKVPITVRSDSVNYTWAGNFMAANSDSPVRLWNITSNATVAENGYPNSTLSFTMSGYGYYQSGCHSTMLRLHVLVTGNLSSNLRANAIDIVVQKTASYPSRLCVIGHPSSHPDDNTTWPSEPIEHIYNPFAFSQYSYIKNDTNLAHNERFHFSYFGRLVISPYGGDPIQLGHGYNLTFIAIIDGLSKPVPMNMDLNIVSVS